MSLTWYGVMIAAGLFLSMLMLLEIRRGIVMRRLAQDPEGAPRRIGVVDGAVFGLLGLLLAFTFSGAATRFEARRQLIVEEANSIRTAWRRLDFLPLDEELSLRELFRQYLDSRLATDRKLPDFATAKGELAHSIGLQSEIWTNVVARGREHGLQPYHTLLLSALDQMFDNATKRVEAMKTHQPVVVFAVLGVVSMTASLLAGYGMAGGKGRSWVHIIGFATVVALTIHVILEFEFPRFGFINLHSADSVLIELREGMR